MNIFSHDALGTMIMHAKSLRMRLLALIFFFASPVKKRSKIMEIVAAVSGLYLFSIHVAPNSVLCRIKELSSEIVIDSHGFS
jgi:hypothetical protein